MPDAPQVAGWPDNGLRFDYGTIYCYRSSQAGTYEVVLGSDPRLSDARTPTAHTHALSDTSGLVTALAGKEDAGTAASVLQGHLDAPDPHPQYAGGGGGSELLDTEYIYDEDGNLLSLEDENGTETFNYDEDWNVTSITGTGTHQSVSFTYDEAGNMTYQEVL